MDDVELSKEEKRRAEARRAAQANADKGLGYGFIMLGLCMAVIGGTANGLREMLPPPPFLSPYLFIIGGLLLAIFGVVLLISASRR